MCLPRCQVLGVINCTNERRKIYYSVCSVTVLELGFGLNRPNGMHTKRQVAFIFCSYFCTILNPRCNSPSNRHHTAGGVYCTFDWSAKNISHNNFWSNIRMYINQGPFIGCLQTTKAQYWIEGNWLQTTGCSLTTQLKPLVTVQISGSSHKDVIISSRHVSTIKQYTSLFMAAAHLQV